MLKPIPVSPLMAERVRAQANKPLIPFMRKPGAAKEVKDVTLLLDTKNGQMQRVHGHYQVDGKTKIISHGLGMRLARDYLIGQQEGPILFRPMLPGQFETPRAAPKPPVATGTPESVSSYHTARTHTASSSVYSTPSNLAVTNVSDARSTPAPLNIARKPLATAAKTTQVASSAATSEPATTPTPAPLKVPRKPIAAAANATVVASSLPLGSAEEGPVIKDSAFRWSQDLLASAFAKADAVGSEFVANAPRQIANYTKSIALSQSSVSERPASQTLARTNDLPLLLKLDGIALKNVKSAPASPRPGLLGAVRSQRGHLAEVNWFTASAEPSPGLRAYMPEETLYSNKSALASSVVLSKHERSAQGLLAIPPPAAPVTSKSDMLTRSNTFTEKGLVRYKLGRLKKDDADFAPSLTRTTKTSHQGFFKDLLARLVTRSPVSGDRQY